MAVVGVTSWPDHVHPTARRCAGHEVVVLPPRCVHLYRWKEQKYTNDKNKIKPCTILRTRVQQYVLLCHPLAEIAVHTNATGTVLLTWLMYTAVSILSRVLIFEHILFFAVFSFFLCAFFLVIFVDGRKQNVNLVSARGSARSVERPSDTVPS